jgi:hypothetical protein
VQAHLEKVNSSKEKEMSKNVLLMSVSILKDRTAVHSNIDDKLLYPEIKTAQDMYIHPLLGTALYSKLISDISGLGPVGAYKTLLDDYILDCLYNYVLSQLPIALPFQFWNKGVLRKQGENTDTPTMSELIDISNFYKDRAEWYGERLVRYLKSTSTSSVLPEYLSPGDTLDTIIPDNTVFTCSIFLGGTGRYESLDKNNCNCNE